MSSSCFSRLLTTDGIDVVVGELAVVSVKLLVQVLSAAGGRAWICRGCYWDMLLGSLHGSSRHARLRPEAAIDGAGDSSWYSSSNVRDSVLSHAMFIPCFER